MIEVSRHKLVPLHEVLSKKEKEEVLRKFNAKEDELPKILATDSIARKLNPKAGDVIKITRNSITAGQAVYYRVVTEY